MTNKSLSETDKSNMCLSHDHLTRNTAEVFRCNDCQIDFICSNLSIQKFSVLEGMILKSGSLPFIGSLNFVIS